MVDPLYGYYGRNQSVEDRKCAALSEVLFCLFSRFRRHCGYAKLASNVTTQKIRHRLIVSRGDWLGNPAKIKDEKNTIMIIFLKFRKFQPEIYYYLKKRV